MEALICDISDFYAEKVLTHAGHDSSALTSFQAATAVFLFCSISFFFWRYHLFVILYHDFRNFILRFC